MIPAPATASGGSFSKGKTMAAGEDKQFRWSQSIPEDWLPLLDAEVEKSGKTRVGFVRDLIREAIPKSYRKNLSEPQAAGRPKDETQKRG